MRLRAFRALARAPVARMTLGALAAMLGLPASTLCLHLNAVTHAGLVTQQRDGRHLIYRPSIERVDALLDYLGAHCCHGRPCAPSPAVRRRARC